MLEDDSDETAGRDLDGEVLSRMMRTSREYPADSDKLILIASALGIGHAEIGRRLRRLERRGRGIVTVRPGVYAFDAGAIREPKVTAGNRTLKRPARLSYLPEEMTRSLAMKAVAALLKNDADHRDAGHPHVTVFPVERLTLPGTGNPPRFG